MIKPKLLFLFFLIGNIAVAQNKQQLNLDAAIAEAVANNRAISIAKVEEKIAAAKLKQTEAIFLPQLSFSYTALTTNNPLNAFGFKLQQQTISQMDFDPNLLNHPKGTPDFMTKIDVQQPLINMDLMYMRNAAKKQTEIHQYKTKRTQEYITFEVQKAYYQLMMAYKALSVLEESLNTAKQVNQFTNNYFKQGLIQKSDVLNTEVFITTIETNIIKTKSNIASASDFLSLLMGKSTATIYTVAEEFNQKKLIDTANTISDKRADFLAMQRAIDASDLMIKSSKMSYLPKLNAFGAYQLNDAAMFGFGANAYLAGVQLSWNIFKGNSTKNKIATQLIEKNKISEELLQQKEQSKLELAKTIRDIKDTEATMLQNNKAIEQSTEALRILQNRYQQGLINTTDVLMAANQLSQQKLNLQQTLFSLNVSQAYLQLLTTSNN